MAHIGIDLGTTNSVVAFLEAGVPQVIPSPEGHKVTPSVVYYAKETETVVGEIAKRQLITQSDKTVRSVKRLMGRRFAESRDIIDTLPYPIHTSQEGGILIDVGYTQKTPEEVSSEILKRLVLTAEEYLNQNIDGAVITVPAHFNDNQRQATKRAATLAGLNVLRIINEPTAAALAYGLNNDTSGTVAVFDFGGGTFDISILSLDKDVFEVISTNGNTMLGGDNIDELIYHWMCETFEREHGFDLRANPQSIQRVREAAEKAKCELSSLTSTNINLPFIAADSSGPKHLEMELDRVTFEELAKEMLAQLLPPCRQALTDANMTPKDIDVVLLVGGSTRIPAVQHMVADFFGRQPSKSINPDEAVALGAAIQAGIISGDIEEVLLLDITPLSLGVELEGGVFSPIIQRNSSIPVTAHKRYTTVVDNQSAVRVHVLQGERKISSENTSLAVFRLTDIEPAPREVPEIEVKFHLDANGILNVSATDLTSGISKEVAVEAYQQVVATDIENILKDADEKKDVDRAHIGIAQQRIRSQKFFYFITTYIEQHPKAVPEEEQRSVKETLIRLDIAIEKQDKEAIVEHEAFLMAFCERYEIDAGLRMGQL